MSSCSISDVQHVALAAGRLSVMDRQYAPLMVAAIVSAALPKDFNGRGLLVEAQAAGRLSADMQIPPGSMLVRRRCRYCSGTGSRLRRVWERLAGTRQRRQAVRSAPCGYCKASGWDYYLRRL